MTLIVVHAAATWFLVGLIWIVQAVHYPLFEAVGRESFPGYQRGHVARITPIVAPVMGLELVTGLMLAIDPPLAPDAGWYRVGLALIATVWAVTGLVSVPAHARLERSFDPATHRRLVRSNWLRTSAWTLRGLLVAWLLLAAAPAVG